MKNTIFFIFTSIFFSVYTGSAQSGTSHLVITYETEYSIPASYGKAAEVMNNGVVVYKYTYADNKSVYRFLESRKKNPDIKGSSNPGPIIYHDFKNKKAYGQSVKDTALVGCDTLILNEWKIQSNETKEILGRTCKKAVLGDGNTVAWFCTEIPIPDGPAGYNGLPGIILAFESGVMRIQAVNIAKTDETKPIEIPKRVKYLSMAEFNKTMAH